MQRRIIFLSAVGLFLSTFLGGFAQQENEGKVWYYVAFGDSIGAGYNNDGRSYVGFYASTLEQITNVQINVIDKTRLGWRSVELLKALRTEGSFRTSLKNAKIITWNIVGNDLLIARQRYQRQTCGGLDNQDCLRQAEAQIEANWVGIIDEILAIRQTDRHLIRTLDFYNPLVNKDRAQDSWVQDGNCNDLNGNGSCSDFEVFKPFFDRVNAFLANSAQARGIAIAKVSQAFNGPNGDIDPGDKGYIGSDGFHPNDTGHQLIAQLLSDLDYTPLWPESTVDDNDRDGDGVVDEEDLCPDFPGTPIANGC